MDNPDDSALQDECAARLFAYAAKLRNELFTIESNVFDARREEADNDNN
jgi:hypothetical protein